MAFKRIVLLLGAFLFIYLGIYAWNSRSGFVDRLAEHTGLEFVGTVLRPGIWVQDTVSNFWSHYLYLVDVRAENDRLREQVDSLSHALSQTREDAAELRRLRGLLLLTPPEGWLLRSSRVLAGRVGLLADVDAMIIGNGYFTGAGAGTPVATETGVVGRVLRAAPYTSTILLVTDPGSNIAVIGSTSRVAGILTGNGANTPLDLNYVSRGLALEPGEILVTSGRDKTFPPGLPVAYVTSMEDDPVMPFKRVQAEPLVDLEAVQIVLLLERYVEPYGISAHGEFGQGDGPQQPLPQSLNPAPFQGHGPALPGGTAHEMAVDAAVLGGA